MTLIGVAEAQARVLALGAPLAMEQAALVAAAGRWAAADIVARRTQPAADLSAMDGYAIRHAELPGPWRMIGESAAGAGLARPLAPGETARIFTGAPLPEGADTILIQEDATQDGDIVRLAGDGPATRGRHVRAIGSDFAAGTRLIAMGAEITAARIALAALGGHGVLPVRRRPRIALLSTGDELVAPGAPIAGVALPSSNAPMLAAMLAALPCEPIDHGIVPDRLDALTAALARAGADADIVVTTGGASVGARDLVRPALAEAGARLDFWRVAMRPGKPLIAGTLGRAVLLGLPGNPVSAYVTALLFLLPLARHLAGDPAPLPKTTRARLAVPLPAAGPRADYIRARIGDDGVAPLAGQDSAMVAALAGADALIVRPAGAPAAETGDFTDILALA